MGNPFVHVELNTGDTVRARKFYKALFDWKTQDMEMGGDGLYTMIDTGKGTTGGGMQKSPMPGSPPLWLAYVEVDDVKKSIARAKKLGGQIIVEHQDVGMGVLGIFCDPTGAMLGVWQPKAPAAATPPPAPAPAAKPAPQKAAAKPVPKKPAAKAAPKKPAAKKPGKSKRK